VPIDVDRLRRDARERAAARPRRAFAGLVDDLMHEGVAMRRYVPDERTPGTAVVFLHGGYGLLGDLEMQDDHCRRLAGSLGVVVLSVDYRLVELDGAEHGFAGTERVEEALAAFRSLTA
jgi:acetyl esterase